MEQEDIPDIWGVIKLGYSRPTQTLFYINITIVDIFVLNSYISHHLTNNEATTNTEVIYKIILR